MSYSSVRESFAKVLDQVNDDHAPIMVTRQRGRPAVLMSLEDFQAYEETFYLMSSPKNAKRLNDAITEIEAGNTQKHGLIEE